METENTIPQTILDEIKLIKDKISSIREKVKETKQQLKTIQDEGGNK